MLSDWVLKGRVNLAFMRDPRVGVLDIGVNVNEGRVTLIGDVDTEEERAAAEEIAAHVEGVTSINNQITCGIGMTEDTAELVTQKLLEKLQDEWDALPEQTALTQADYLRWALWVVYKFRLPIPVLTEERDRLVSEATDQALTQLSSYVGASKALLAIEMRRQAESIAASPHQDAPETEHIPLVATPIVEEGTE